jgi:membrane-associated phospholipid phosphatase
MAMNEQNLAHPVRSTYDAMDITGEAVPHQRWADLLARVASEVASPPILAVVMAGLCAAHSPASESWRWATLHAGLTVGIPVAFLVWLVARGTVSDLDVQRREQRARPMFVALAGAAASLALQCLGPAPQLMLVLGLATYLQLLLVFIVTLHWKISVHTTAAASFTVLLVSLYGSQALPLIGLLLLLGWARIRLNRHTFAQTAAGALWGGLSMTIAVTLGR